MKVVSINSTTSLDKGLTKVVKYAGGFPSGFVDSLKKTFRLNKEGDSCWSMDGGKSKNN